jgi:Tfp pilus assembly protein PilF/ubiquinone/menaquinone biosynthesis C-methylase UbiE
MSFQNDIILKKSLKLSMKTNIDQLFNQAFALHKEGKLEEAVSRYNQILEINPNYTNAYYNLAIVFQESGEVQKAKVCYEKAIEIDPNLINVHYNLGNLLSDIGEYQKAKVCYEKVIEIDPNFEIAHNNLGAIFQSLKENQKAKVCFEKVIKLNPNLSFTHNNLGIVCQELGEVQKAISCYEKLIEINPNNQNTINSLSLFLSEYRFDHKSLNNIYGLQEIFLFLFKKNNINHSNIFQNVKLILFSQEEENKLLESVNSDSLLKDKILQSLLKDELFLLVIQKSLIVDKFLEKLLIKLRYEIFLTLESSNINFLKNYLNFVISLAEQSWLNEYVYVQSEKEAKKINKLKNKIEESHEINELEIAILGAYIPLNSSKNIIDKLSDYKSSNTLFNDLINMQINEPLRELGLVKSIESLDIIDDTVSKKVRKQYEENPFPRWRFIHKSLPTNFFNIINTNIKPNQIDYNTKFNNPNVLIAGCGTGSHPIQATHYKSSNILAVDLSLKSLAYAKRKTEELDYKNIKYLHADILHLNKLNRKFDIIECMGTLHHMKEPTEGLKILLDVLEPHGFLKLGLYSETAKQHTVKVSELFKKRNLKNTNKNIINFRQEILGEKIDPQIQKVSQSVDFYSTSNVRDLLFHSQEFRFTIPQISKILNDLRLEFLGFCFDNTDIKKKYSKSFSNDKENISLDNWHQFELQYPDTFWGMYNFWVRKI